MQYLHYRKDIVLYCQYRALILTSSSPNADVLIPTGDQVSVHVNDEIIKYSVIICENPFC